MKYFSIRLKLFTLVILILLPLTALQALRIRSAFHDHVQKELAANRDIAEAISTSFLNCIEEIWAQETVLAAYLNINPNTPLEEIQAYLDEIADKQKTALGITWVNAEGTAAASSKKAIIGRMITRTVSPLV